MRRLVWVAAVVPWLVLTVGCTPVKAKPYDFDGDGRADRVVIDVSTGRWSSIEPGHTFGSITDKIAGVVLTRPQPIASNRRCGTNLVSAFMRAGS